MNKLKVVLISCTSLFSVTAITTGALAIEGRGLFRKVRESLYTLVIDENNPLDGGDVKTNGGTTIHFDEYGVNENVGDGALLELAAYGNIALQTYISGIKTARVYSETGEGKDFFLSVGATPNSCEFTQPSINGVSTVNLDGGYEGDVFYFSIHNKNQTQLKINKIEIDYSCVDNENGLKSIIGGAIAFSGDITYSGNPINPYDGCEIDPSLIPENRKLIKTMDEYPTAPGRYTYGYEVYDTDENGNARKLLYTKTNSFRIIGTQFNPIPDNRRVLTFHIPDENGKEKLVFKTTDNSSFNLSDLPTECLPYNWESPYNEFNYIGDEHYYPVFNVTGLSANKEGDGCLPVSVTYSYLERGFTMPEPVMKHGYRFGGWFLNQGLTEIFDPNQLHPGNLVLYAKCIKTDDYVRPVYYHNEDGTLSNHVDYLYSSDNKIEMPVGENIIPNLRAMEPFTWSLFVGDNYQRLLLPPADFEYEGGETSHRKGDEIKYSDFTSLDGEIHIYANELKLIPWNDWSYDLITEDADKNHIFQHTYMANKYQRETDFLVHSLACIEDEYTGYHYVRDSFPIDRTGSFFFTDEKKAYVYDSGTLKNMTSHCYGNISMKKPLSGILRHESVRKVGRRAFFNRYGLKGTYFPKNAVEFDTEAYANVTFDRILTLPHNLTKIGDRCFMGAENIRFVCLPRTIKSIGPNAFAYGVYNPETRVFENIENRTAPGRTAFTFLYEGSKEDFERLDEESQNAVKNNANTIIYNYTYGTYYGRG